MCPSLNVFERDSRCVRVNVLRVPTPPMFQLVAPVSASISDVQSSIFKIRVEVVVVSIEHLPALRHLILCKLRCLSRISSHWHHHQDCFA